MARTPSNHDLPLGTLCPPFELPDAVSGSTFTRDQLVRGSADSPGRNGLLVAFLSVHCPFVQHMEQAFSTLTAQYADRIATVAICSNDSEAFPEDAPEKMKQQAQRLGWQFPYLVDQSQDTAHDFHAACTPDLYLFDRELALVYHAQFDATRPYRQSDANNGVIKDDLIHQPAHGADLRAAIENLLAGNSPLATQIPSLGCNIKWR